MANTWFVRRGEKTTGPVESADLKQLASTGRLLPTDLVQKEGSQDWVPAARIKGLFAAPTGKPPALPTTPGDVGGVTFPPVVPPQFSPPPKQDPTGGLIPVNNPQALIAYYTGIFLSPCCLVGLPLGLVPLVFGIRGLSARKRNPEIKGSVHAWIGVVLGGLSTLSTLVLWATVAWNMLNQR